jgi:microcompartment protein CcmL/EutN
MASRRQIIDRANAANARANSAAAHLAAFEGDADACASALEQVSAELSRAKDVIALHIVAAGHPSTVLHDVRSFADALQQALTDAGVDLQIELARLEGAEL